MSTRERLRQDLVAAIRSRDRIEISMIRTLIAAIENAEAVAAEPSAEVLIGLNHDRPRRRLTGEQITAIVARERAEVADAVERYRELGLDAELGELQARVAIIDRYTELS